MRFDEIVTCPFCAEKLRLAELPIVATNVVRESSDGAQVERERSDGGLFEGLAQPNETDEEPSGPPSLKSSLLDIAPVSGAGVLTRDGRPDVRSGWPVIAYTPSPPEEPNRMWRLIRGHEEQRIPPLWELAQPEDLPARLCTNCETPLPVDIDERRLITIAVVGTNGSGKTHFIASALHDAYHDQALERAFGCLEFAPDEATSDRYHNEYYRPLFADRVALLPTQVEQDVRFNPLAFRATFERNPKPVTLLFHDVPGEVLRDRAQRARVAPFVRRADAVIFLIDPRWFSPIGVHLEEEYGIPNETAGFNQADLFNAVAQEMRSRSLDQVPVSVAISKADLITAALGGRYAFGLDTPKDRDSWIQQMKEIDDEIVELLKNELRAPDLLAAVDQFPDVTFHAVAPIGSQPGTMDASNRQAVSELNPSRCLDPLVSVLLSVLSI